ncbi:MAG TPA: hypothetical protein VKS78_15390 [Roseiarcus sp.]|nr:hypothetical protein [Roseiarcus sp.]
MRGAAEARQALRGSTRRTPFWSDRLASGQEEIRRALGGLHQAGWTTVAIDVVDARALPGVVIFASKFNAHGSGALAGKSLSGKSSYALSRVGGEWLAAMHTAA